jgi:hypothetical protein
MSAVVVVHGLLALIIVLLILAIIVLGVISLLRLAERGVKHAAEEVRK